MVYYWFMTTTPEVIKYIIIIITKKITERVNDEYAPTENFKQEEVCMYDYIFQKIKVFDKRKYNRIFIVDFDGCHDFTTFYTLHFFK